MKFKTIQDLFDILQPHYVDMPNYHIAYLPLSTYKALVYDWELQKIHITNIYNISFMPFDESTTKLGIPEWAARVFHDYKFNDAINKIIDE